MKLTQEIFEQVVPRIKMTQTETYFITAYNTTLIPKAILMKEHSSRESACNALAILSEHIELKAKKEVVNGTLTLEDYHVVTETLLDNLVSHISQYLYMYENYGHTGVYGLDS